MKIVGWMVCRGNIGFQRDPGWRVLIGIRPDCFLDEPTGVCIQKTLLNSIIQFSNPRLNIIKADPSQYTLLSIIKHRATTHAWWSLHDVACQGNEYQPL